MAAHLVQHALRPRTAARARVGLGFAAQFRRPPSPSSLRAPRSASRRAFPSSPSQSSLLSPALNFCQLLRQDPLVYVESTKNLDARLPYDQAIPPLLRRLLRPSPGPRADGYVGLSRNRLRSPEFLSAKPSMRATSILRSALAAPATHAASSWPSTATQVDRAVKAHPEDLSVAGRFTAKASHRQPFISPHRGSIGFQIGLSSHSLRPSPPLSLIRSTTRHSAVIASVPRNRHGHCAESCWLKLCPSSALARSSRFGGRLIPFTKAHACGNDFLIVTEEAAGNHDRADLTRRLCARNTGIGADGIEFFTWTGRAKSRPHPPHNADGSIAEISGNGTRCVAAWMAEALARNPAMFCRSTTDAGPRSADRQGGRPTTDLRSKSLPAWACPILPAHAEADRRH